MVEAATVHGMDDGDDWLTEHYDAFDEHGLADNPAAWSALDAVRAELAEHGRVIWVRRD